MFGEFTIHIGLGLGAKKAAVIFSAILILIVYDFISLKDDAINLLSSTNTLIRRLAYNTLIVITFFLYTTLAVTDAAFVYFQF